VEGNPIHPAVQGKSGTWAQSSILDLYDPERSRYFLKDGGKTTAEDFDKALTEVLSKAGQGAGVAILAEKCSSPTRSRLRDEIAKKYPASAWYAYEPAGGDDRAAAALFGEGITPTAKLDQADVIMALDCDFLSCHEGTVEGVRQFSSRRKLDGPEAKMNRLYVVENRYTVTGGMADHRLRLPASQIGAFLVALAKALIKTTGDKTLAAAVDALHNNPEVSFDADWVRESAADLLAAKGRSLVLVGDRQPAAAQALGYAINAALGNLGTTLVGRPAFEKAAPGIAELARAIDDKKVQTLFILGGNPAYNAPAELSWPDLQKKVATVVRLGCHEDETSQGAQWHVPKAHYLEAGGDGRATDGSYTSVQPMIVPLYGGWSELDLLARLAGRPKPDGPILIQETFREIAGNPADFVTTWAKFVHDGFLEKSAAKDDKLSLKAEAIPTFLGKFGSLPAIIAEGTYEIVLVPDSKMDDGRHANNGWLQEIPDPITKLTWDNAAWISPATARKLNVSIEEREVPMIEIAVEERKIQIPVIIAPGHADNSITVPLGYGRTVTGRVGRHAGVSAYPLRTSEQPWLLKNGRVEIIEGTYLLGITQEHGALEGRGADLVRESNLTDYKKTASAAPESEESQFYKKMGMDATREANVSLYSHPPLSDPYQWGMTIDLNTCTGCSACTVACQAENNIPIVGKDQVTRNRNMHWLRMDRYFATDDGNEDDPEMVSQPMLCQQCENAPCETVCPVNATVHSEDGINVMAYNRCIGTRYCANNCPFKVRRFNFFDYNQRDVLGHQPGELFTGLYKWNLIAAKGSPDTIKMQKNPNVTVRMRGVMEKCNFCIQRIQEAKIATKVHSRDGALQKIPTDSFTSACAQACPTEAIKFGNIADPESEVSKIRKDQRGYRLLEYLNVASRITYLARVRNPNPKMPGADKLGSYIHPQHETPHDGPMATERNS
jgi:molybdopterin-containing oxidoreductase family iron-sulfur binding subunit